MKTIVISADSEVIMVVNANSWKSFIFGVQQITVDTEHRNTIEEAITMQRIGEDFMSADIDKMWLFLETDMIEFKEVPFVQC